MKVLFISSGNKKTGISPITFNQGESLKAYGIDIQYFVIKGKGISGYIRHIFTLRKYLITNKFDIYHAHYSDSAFVAALAGAKPLVVSLMGTDAQPGKLRQFIFYIFKHFFWQNIIVKSLDMKNKLDINNINVIPNGVNIQRFRQLDKKITREKIGWSSEKIHILFAADPVVFEKNFSLAKDSFNKLNNEQAVLHILKNIKNEEVPDYFNASDLVLLTSLWEGSPNVIKEAMACNCPIVSTDVGDVRWVMENIEGCFITTFDVKDATNKIKLALDYSEKIGRTKGRERIINLGLDSESIAKRIIKVYENVLNT